MRRLRPRPAGEPIPCVLVRDSSSNEESPDVYPRRAASPTQPWPPPDAAAATRAFGYDDADMGWGGIDTGRTPSPPPEPRFSASCESGSPQGEVPFEYTPSQRSSDARRRRLM